MDKPLLELLSAPACVTLAPAALLDVLKVGWNTDLPVPDKVRKTRRRLEALSAMCHVASGTALVGRGPIPELASGRWVAVALADAVASHQWLLAADLCDWWLGRLYEDGATEWLP